MTKYLTRKQVSEIYNLSVSFLERAARSGALNPIRLSARKLLYKSSDVEAWLDSHISEPTRTGRKRRGRPTKAEQIARRQAQQAETS